MLEFVFYLVSLLSDSLSRLLKLLIVQTIPSVSGLLKGLFGDLLNQLLELFISLAVPAVLQLSLLADLLTCALSADRGDLSDLADLDSSILSASSPSF